MDKLVARLYRFVEEEYSAQLKQRRGLWRRKIDQRVDSGQAIDKITIVEFDRDSATLELEDNRSQFSVGDLLRLSRDDPEGGYVGCVLDKEDGAQLFVSPGHLQSFRKLRRSSGWTLDADLIDQRQPLIAALDDLSAARTASARLVGRILAGARPEINRTREQQAQQRTAHLGLEVHQREAMIRGLCTKNYWVAHGAPTTGKTHVLAELAAALAREGQRVFITGPDHFSINHALHTIAAVTGYTPLCKVGDPRRVEGLADEKARVPSYETFTASALHPTDRGIIVGGLPTGVRTDSSLGAISFDTVIFDDAERISLPEAIAAMLAGERYIFLGDPVGIPPRVYGTYRQSWVAQSALDYAGRLELGTSLEMSFCLNEQLAEFPSQHFYNRRLRARPRVASRRFELAVEPPWPRLQEVLDPDHSSIFIESEHQGCDVVSVEEARVAAWLVVAIALGCKYPADQIAVLSPYRAQSRLIRTGAVELAESHGDRLPPGILFGAPEDLHPNGRNLAIISLATSDLKRAFARGDDTFSLPRLNLALTRAAVKRIVIGSPYLLSAKPPDLALANWLSLIRQLAEDSKRVPLKVRDNG